MRWIPDPDHEVCGIAKTDISVRMLRAWARCIAFASEQASYDELMHAREHFRLIRDAQCGHPGHIDSMCLDNVNAELEFRISGAV